MHRYDFPVQNVKRFVLAVFGGLTLMVTVWATTMLGMSVLAITGESRRLFTAILVFFCLLIVVGFSVVWTILRRYPHAVVVRERAFVLEHGARTRVLPFAELRGVERRAEYGVTLQVVHVADGSEIALGSDEHADLVARALVTQAGLEWSEPGERRRSSSPPRHQV